MLTKDLSTAEGVQPCFIETMYAEAVRELPDGSSGGMSEARWRRVAEM